MRELELIHAATAELYANQDMSFSSVSYCFSNYSKSLKKFDPTNVRIFLLRNDLCVNPRSYACNLEFLIQIYANHYQLPWLIELLANLFFSTPESFYLIFENKINGEKPWIVDVFYRPHLYCINNKVEEEKLIRSATELLERFNDVKLTILLKFKDFSIFTLNHSQETSKQLLKLIKSMSAPSRLALLSSTVGETGAILLFILIGKKTHRDLQFDLQLVALLLDDIPSSYLVNFLLNLIGNVTIFEMLINNMKDSMAYKNMPKNFLILFYRALTPQQKAFVDKHRLDSNSMSFKWKLFFEVIDRHEIVKHKTMPKMRKDKVPSPPNPLPSIDAILTLSATAPPPLTQTFTTHGEQDRDPFFHEAKRFLSEPASPSKKQKLSADEEVDKYFNYDKFSNEFKNEDDNPPLPSPDTVPTLSVETTDNAMESVMEISSFENEKQQYLMEYIPRRLFEMDKHKEKWGRRDCEIKLEEIFILFGQLNPTNLIKCLLIAGHNTIVILAWISCYTYCQPPKKQDNSIWCLLASHPSKDPHDHENLYKLLFAQDSIGKYILLNTLKELLYSKLYSNLINALLDLLNILPAKHINSLLQIRNYDTDELVYLLCKANKNSCSYFLLRLFMKPDFKICCDKAKVVKLIFFERCAKFSADLITCFFDFILLQSPQEIEEWLQITDAKLGGLLPFLLRNSNKPEEVLNGVYNALMPLSQISRERLLDQRQHKKSFQEVANDMGVGDLYENVISALDASIIPNTDPSPPRQSSAKRSLD